MEEKNYCCSQKAANWWSKQIRNFNRTEIIRGLDVFEKLLAQHIQNIVAINGQMNICTYGSSSTILSEISVQALLYAHIPDGYEMRIIMDDVYVYDSFGQLVTSF